MQLWAKLPVTKHRVRSGIGASLRFDVVDLAFGRLQRFFAIGAQAALILVQIGFDG